MQSTSGTPTSPSSWEILTPAYFSALSAPSNVPPGRPVRPPPQSKPRTTRLTPPTLRLTPPKPPSTRPTRPTSSTSFTSDRPPTRSRTIGSSSEREKGKGKGRLSASVPFSLEQDGLEEWHPEERPPKKRRRVESPEPSTVLSLPNPQGSTHLLPSSTTRYNAIQSQSLPAKQSKIDSVEHVLSVEEVVGETEGENTAHTNEETNRVDSWGFEDGSL
ncbi:2664_t:CDS:2, partial [Acaulospora colombiana]